MSLAVLGIKLLRFYSFDSHHETFVFLQVELDREVVCLLGASEQTNKSLKSIACSFVALFFKINVDFLQDVWSHSLSGIVVGIFVSLFLRYFLSEDCFLVSYLSVEVFINFLKLFNGF